MLGFPASLRIYLALAPVDMRKQFNGLFGAAQNELGLDPRQGALIGFTNKTRTRIKLLYWDGTGLWVLAKRLEQGRFSWPASAGGDGRRLQLTPEAMTMLLGGIELKKGHKKAWYEV